MLDKIDLSVKMDKGEYKEQVKALEKKLVLLQQEINALEIPVVIVVEGFSAAGKGTLIGKILNPLDPRYFNVYTMGKISENDEMRPFLWRYGIKMTFKGRMTIFDKSWHRLIVPDGNKKKLLSEKERKGFYYDVNAFERQLSDDGVQIIKLFICISKEEQRKRFKALQKNKDTSWRVNENDFLQNDNYDKYVKHFNDMIRNTNSRESQWSVIEADDLRYATVKILKILTNRLEVAVDQQKRKRAIIVPEKGIELAFNENSILKTVSLDKVISDEAYSDKLMEYQRQISELGFKLYAKRKSVVIVYEGWDAAGKGGNIRRLTEKLDPRGFEVIPVAAPSKGELAHHYLWRFYTKLPKDGHIAIFDRSWYGRVLVERIEGYCSQEEWTRAYKEINDFEFHLANHDCIIIKFWLQIDKDEQLRRFEARQENPEKQHKITDEDWRNREKWDLYEKAVDEMLFKTNTHYAPWTIIESNNKKFARIKVLEIVNKEIKKGLSGL